jgi:hypothetical protein
LIAAARLGATLLALLSVLGLGAAYLGGFTLVLLALASLVDGAWTVILGALAAVVVTFFYAIWVPYPVDQAWEERRSLALLGLAPFALMLTLFGLAPVQGWNELRTGTLARFDPAAPGHSAGSSLLSFAPLTPRPDLMAISERVTTRRETTTISIIAVIPIVPRDWTRADPVSAVVTCRLPPAGPQAPALARCLRALPRPLVQAMRAGPGPVEVLASRRGLTLHPQVVVLQPMADFAEAERAMLRNLGWITASIWAAWAATVCLILAVGAVRRVLARPGRP